MERHELTPEARAALIGLAPFDEGAIDKFCPPSYADNQDIPDEYKAIFEQRPYTQREKERVTVLMRQVADPKQRDKVQDKEIDKYVRMTVKGVSKLFDIGKEDYIEFEADTDVGCMSAPQYDLLTSKCRAELMWNALRISGLLDVEKLGLG